MAIKTLGFALDLRWQAFIVTFLVILLPHSVYGEDTLSAPLSLCTTILESLTKHGKEIDRSNDVRVEMIITLLTQIAKTEAAEIRETGKYEALVKKLENKDQTIHAIGRNRYDDTRVILTLPKPGEKTIWDFLNPDEREWLALRLEHILKVGLYDYDLLNKSPGHTELWYALQSMIQDPQVSDYSSGIVPRLALHRCTTGGIMGVCRHSTAVLAGLLGELGLPPNQIRLVTGSESLTDPTKHIWIEVQLVRGANQWMVLDPTSKNRQVDEGIKGGSSNSNRHRYIYNVKEIRDFLVPK